MTKKDNEDFENSIKCWIRDTDYIDNDVKVRDHCHITGKYKGSAHRDCNINVLTQISASAVIKRVHFASHLQMQVLTRKFICDNQLFLRKLINGICIFDKAAADKNMNAWLL